MTLLEQYLKNNEKLKLDPRAVLVFRCPDECENLELGDWQAYCRGKRDSGNDMESSDWICNKCWAYECK